MSLGLCDHLKSDDWISSFIFRDYHPPCFMCSKIFLDPQTSSFAALERLHSQGVIMLFLEERYLCFYSNMFTVSKLNGYVIFRVLTIS